MGFRNSELGFRNYGISDFGIMNSDFMYSPPALSLLRNDRPHPNPSPGGEGLKNVNVNNIDKVIT